MTRGSSGADLASLMNAAAIRAVRHGRCDISMVDLEQALLRTTIGQERNVSRSGDENEIIAFHEAGHAVVAARLLPPGSVRMVSIVARGNAGGITVIEPPGDLASMDELERHLAVLMGGRVGEEIRGGRRAVTVGASADIEAANGLAKNMVKKLGLGKDMFPKADDVDRHVRELLSIAYKRARHVLYKNFAKNLKLVANALLERSTLSDKELGHLIKM